MSYKKRIFWFVILLVVQSLYFPINKYVHGGVIIATPWDSYIPLWSIWAVPYLLSLFWWLGSFIWAVAKMDDELYIALVVAIIFAMLTSYVIYLFYPTYIERPLLKEGEGWSVDLIRFIYSRDRSYNVFPSGHTYTSVLIALFWVRWYPEKRWLWIIIALVVLLSTLFTGQHYFADVISGTLLAWAGYRFGLWYAARSVREKI